MTEKPKKWYEPFYALEYVEYESEEEAEKYLLTKCDAYNYSSRETAQLALNLILQYPESAKFKIILAKHVIISLETGPERQQDLLIDPTIRFEGKLEAMDPKLTEKINVDLKALDFGSNLKSDPEILEYKAILQYRLGNFGEALQLLQTVSSSQPDNIRPLLSKAAVLEAQKEYEQASKLHDEIKRRFPNSSELFLIEAWFSVQQLNLDQALTMFEQIAKKEGSKNAFTFAHIGRVHYLRKDFERAQHFFEKALNLDNDLAIAHLYFGDLYAFKRNWVDALFRYQTCAKITLVGIDVLNRFRNVLDEKTGSKETNTTLNYGSDNISKTSFAVDNDLYGMLKNFRVGKYSKSLAYLEKKKESKPENPKFRVFMAKSHLMLHDKTSAISELNAALANVNIKLATPGRGSPALQAYKKELLEKRIVNLKLMIEIASLEADYSVIAVMHAQYRLFDQAFKVYKNKLVLKHMYLPNDPYFDELIAEVKQSLSDFKRDIADMSSPLFIPFNIQNNSSLAAYYRVFTKQTQYFEEIMQKEGLNLGKEAAAIHLVLKNIDPLVKLYSPVSASKAIKVDLKSSNMNMLESNTEKRALLLTNMTHSFVIDNSQRIINASENKEHTLFINEGLMGKYHQYFFEGAKTNSMISSLEELARIDALKLLIVLYNGMFDKTGKATPEEKARQIQRLLEVPFASPAKPSGCLCFIF